jgi:hypothetical protein
VNLYASDIAATTYIAIYSEEMACTIETGAAKFRVLDIKILHLPDY